ncbi:hypothetical protein TNCV_188081 [Trichonephila clavipes]|nr:hypothetical protein TNCV_188081 [Trichonephila clavipes]
MAEPSKHTSRLFLLDRKSGQKFLIDSGSEICVIPPSPTMNKSPQSNFSLFAANNTKIPAYGIKIAEHRDPFKKCLEMENDLFEMYNTSPTGFLFTSLQLVKILQVSCKSIRFHHGALGNVKVLVHIIVQVVRQAVVIQVPEMRQYFQIDCKKSQLFKNFPLIRALHDNEASVSLGQVTKLAPDAEIQVFERHRSGQVTFQAEPFVNVTISPSVFVCREEVGVIHRDTITLGSVPSSGMLAMDSSTGTG